MTRITIVLNHPSRDFTPNVLLQQGLVRTPGAPPAPAQRVGEDRSPDVGHELSPGGSPHLRAAVLLHAPKTSKHGKSFLMICLSFLIILFCLFLSKTSKHGEGVRRVVSHHMQGLPATKPLFNGISFPLGGRRVQVPGHEQVHLGVERVGKSIQDLP